MAYKIGEVAKMTGIHVDTIRYYENIRLLPVPKRAANGYRIYDVNTIKRLQFILNAKTLGFTLKEIEELLSLSEVMTGSCCEMLDFTSGKISEINEKITQLQRIQEVLKNLHHSCKTKGTPEYCPIIESLVNPGGINES